MKSGFLRTKLMVAVAESVSNRFDDVIKHCQDVTTQDEAPCEITAKIKIVPNRDRDRFPWALTDGVKLSPHYGTSGVIFAAIEDGEVVVGEFEPQQQAMPFE